MLCANCKIISIHLPNYDSYICENAHVVCASCQDQSREICAVCGGKIVGQAEFHLEGVTKAYFKTAEDMERCYEVPAAEMPPSQNIKTRRDEEWQSYTAGPPSDVSSCLSKCFSECDDEVDSNWNYGEAPIGDFKHVRPTVGNDEFIQHFLTAKPICDDSENSFGVCSEDLDYLGGSKNLCDAANSVPSIEHLPMDNNEHPPEDPKLLFHKVMSGKLQFDPQRDFYERMSKVNRYQDTFNRPQLEAARNRSFKLKSSMDPKKFAAHSSCPQQILAYIVDETTNHNKQDSQEHYRSNLRPTKNNNEANKETVVDMCLESCLDNINYSKNTSPGNNNKHINFNIPNEAQIPRIHIPHSPQQTDYLQNSLREKLKTEIYSRFEKQPPILEKSNFMTKDNDGNCNSGVRVSDSGPKENNSGSLAEVINTEIEKALKKMSHTENISGTKRREEMIRQSKAQLRQKILKEIYSSFNEHVSSDGKEKDESKTTESVPHHSTVTYSGRFEKLRHKSLSTESYPKLNPDLTVLELSRRKSQHIISNYLLAQSENFCNVCSADSDAIDQAKKNAEPTSPEEQELKVVAEKTTEKVERAIVQPSASEMSEEKLLDSSDAQFVQSDFLIELENLKKSSLYIQNKDSSGPLPTIEEVCYAEPAIPNPPSEQMDDPEKTKKDIANLKENAPDIDVAKALSEDYREEPKNHACNVINFISFIQEKFPKKTLEEMKEILISLPEAPGDFTTKQDESKMDTSSENKKDDSIDSPRTEMSDYSVITINAWRAFYCPPSKEETDSEPPAQFKPVSPLDYDIGCTAVFDKDIRSAAELNLTRSPIVCPISTCNRQIFVSEFSKHIKVDHGKIPVESMSPGKCRNLFLDPKVDQYGVNKCQTLYLVTNKIRDLGSKEYKDFLPVLLMSTKVRVSDFITPERKIKCKDFVSKQPVYLMIWLTGLCAPDLPIHFSITSWARSGSIPKCHIVHSGQLYSIRNSQNPRALYESGQVLLLSNEQCSMLTNEGRDMIELQVVVN